MANDNKELPEGTDKVIAGASSTGGGGTSGTSGSGGSGTGRTSGTGLGGTGAPGDVDGEVLVASDTTVATIAPADTSTGSTSGTASGSGKVIDKLRSGSEKLSGQAAGKARDFVGQGIEKSAEALANVGRMVGETAPSLDDKLGADYGNYARRAAEAIESAASSIASKNADELIDDTRNFVRKSPAVALAGAAVAGFVMARLIKTGLSAALDEDDDEDDGSSSRRGKGGRTSGSSGA